MIKDMQDIYTKNTETSQREIKEDLINKDI